MSPRNNVSPLQHPAGSVATTRSGTQIINANEIVPGDPDPKLFSVPAGYSVVDKREKGEHAQAGPA